jgi:hypothetical protein
MKLGDVKFLEALFDSKFLKLNSIYSELIRTAIEFSRLSVLEMLFNRRDAKIEFKVEPPFLHCWYQCLYLHFFS